MNPIEHIHERSVHGRRVRTLADKLARCVEPGSAVLDVGTGDGTLAARLAEQVEGVSIEGVEVAPRASCAVRVSPFDGRELPFPNGAFDTVLFCDVLHHAEDPLFLLREATRVARSWVLIKDHLLSGFLAGPTLRFMDRVGNRRHGVPVPGNYWTPARWKTAFAELGLSVGAWDTNLGLYPWYLDWWFGRQLHFVAKLQIQKEEFR